MLNSFVFKSAMIESSRLLEELLFYFIISTTTSGEDETKCESETIGGMLCRIG